MAEPTGEITNRVAERIDVMNREIADLVENAGDNADDQLNAMIDAHTLAIRTLGDIVGMLAPEIDRLRDQSAPPG